MKKQRRPEANRKGTRALNEERKPSRLMTRQSAHGTLDLTLDNAIEEILTPSTGLGAVLTKA